MLSGKKVLICGAEGKSGLAAAELCVRAGAHVFLSDRKRSDVLAAFLAIPF